MFGVTFFLYFVKVYSVFSTTYGGLQLGFL